MIVYKLSNMVVNMSEERFEKINDLISEFSDKFLDEELKQLNLKLAHRLESLEDSPLKRGKVENWACAIIYAVGQLNFLFDPAIKPCIANFILCTYFDANQHSMWYKSRDIRRLLKLKLSDEEFSTKYVLSLNILNQKMI